MNLDLTHIEKMLFALLRSALHSTPAEPELFSRISAEEWKLCYQLSCKHGVMALAWDGVNTLPADCMPPQNIRIIWALAVERYEKRYLHYCQTASSMAEFYNSHDIEMIQLKGVGFSTEYPNPKHREGGDIDIYTYAASDSTMSDEQANALADELMQKQGAEFDTHSYYKHSSFRYNGIPIENHKFFLNVKHYKSASHLNELLYKYMNPEKRLLPGTNYPVKVPSAAFNSIFLAYHAAQHYGTGLNLHHLFDWAVLLKNHGLCLPEEVQEPYFLRFVAAFTAMSNRYLGTTVAVEADERLMNEMLQEMLHQKYATTVPSMERLGVLWYKTKRMIYQNRLKSSIFSTAPLWRTVWNSIKFHIKHPETIFSRG